MAEIFFLTRGIKHQRDIFVANMQSQLFPFKRENLNVCKCNHPKHDDKCKECDCLKFESRVEVSAVQGALRPIELWEYCVPEEAIPEVMHYLGMGGNGKQCHAKELENFARVFRFARGIKKLPKYNEKELKILPRLIYREALSIYGLGWKPDEVKDFKWGYKQEGL